MIRRPMAGGPDMDYERSNPSPRLALVVLAAPGRLWKVCRGHEEAAGLPRETETGFGSNLGHREFM